MIGIGSAPNNDLMARMAEAGRGTYTHIGAVGEVTARMTDLLDRLTRPAVTDLRVRLVGSAAEITPDPLPDLYAGEPLILLARGADLHGSLEVSGRIGGRAWSRSIPLGEAVPGLGVARLWARRRISEIEVAAAMGGMEAQAASDAIARLGIDFSLVSRETSLVAVDRTPARPRGARLTREEIPLNLPHGWDFDRLFSGGEAGERAGGAQPGEQSEVLELPQAGTDAATLMRGGVALLILALGGLLALRRRKPACA
jgi:Ca-activated chloride channel family protein